MPRPPRLPLQRRRPASPRARRRRRISRSSARSWAGGPPSTCIWSSFTATTARTCCFWRPSSLRSTPRTPSRTTAPSSPTESCSAAPPATSSSARTWSGSRSPRTGRSLAPRPPWVSSTRDTSRSRGPSSARTCPLAVLEEARIPRVALFTPWASSTRTTTTWRPSSTCWSSCTTRSRRRSCSTVLVSASVSSAWRQRTRASTRSSSRPCTPTRRSQARLRPTRLDW
mmetsp:Transcript_18052/g.63423  ORF Transcript_18052/g.63423 Transcript_18052/m.63423 type:complete len:227 (-) Transcript_18052:1730-2410(-)